ncbi:nucleoside hydrolase [Halosimplex sp. J119]
MVYTAPTETDTRLSEAERVARLEPPDGPVDVVLDTDAYNEIDDQFALVYALLSDRIDVEKVYAAPFHNDNSTGPGDGMEKSYEEIRRLLELLDRPDADELPLRGGAEYMADADGPVETEASADLVERARDRGGDDPLYVISIGAPTNVASAIERAPEIADGVVVVWLGGHPLSWHTAREFNLLQDLRASRVLFDSGVPLVLIPCKNVAEHVRTTIPELEAHLGDGGPVSQFLLERVAECRSRRDASGAWSKPIWDMAPVAYLLEHEWVPTDLVHSPWLSADLRYGRDSSRHLIRVGRDARRDLIFDDFFDKLGSL